MTGIEGWLTRQWTHQSPAACLMWPLQALMQVAVGTRRALYRLGWPSTQTLPVPVIVVGNRIAGGAGKTPTVMAVLAHLSVQGWTPGVLSRGHGRRDAAAAAPLVLDHCSAPKLSAQGVGDEPWLIWRRTRCPMGIARHRFAAGQALLSAHPEINILVCDDGLQHLALARQIEIVVFDERGAGNGWLLPAGPLREPISSPPHPACVTEPLVVYNAPQASTPLSGHLATKALSPLQSLSTWWQGAAAYGSADGGPDAKQPIVGVAGIAQPQRFFQSLQAQGLTITPCPMPDHDRLDPLPWGPEVSQVIMTEKDAVKLTPERLAAQRPRTQVWVAPLSFEIAPAFWLALDQALARLPRAR